ALLAAPTLVASWYGMNFHYMPELGRPYAYPVLIVATLAVCGGLYVALKRAKWLLGGFQSFPSSIAVLLRRPIRSVQPAHAATSTAGPARPRSAAGIAPAPSSTSACRTGSPVADRACARIRPRIGSTRTSARTIPIRRSDDAAWPNRSRVR